ncbi:MAG: CHAT domain-containing protein [Gemmatimonadaceae bacterium]
MDTQAQSPALTGDPRAAMILAEWEKISIRPVDPPTRRRRAVLMSALHDRAMELPLGIDDVVFAARAGALAALELMGLEEDDMWVGVQRARMVVADLTRERVVRSGSREAGEMVERMSGLLVGTARPDDGAFLSRALSRGRSYCGGLAHCPLGTRVAVLELEATLASGHLEDGVRLGRVLMPRVRASGDSLAIGACAATLGRALAGTAPDSAAAFLTTGIEVLAKLADRAPDKRAPSNWATIRLLAESLVLLSRAGQSNEAHRSAVQAAVSTVRRVSPRNESFLEDRFYLLSAIAHAELSLGHQQQALAFADSALSVTHEPQFPTLFADLSRMESQTIRASALQALGHRTLAGEAALEAHRIASGLPALRNSADEVGRLATIARTFLPEKPSLADAYFDTAATILSLRVSQYRSDHARVWQNSFLVGFAGDWSLARLSRTGSRSEALASALAVQEFTRSLGLLSGGAAGAGVPDALRIREVLPSGTALLYYAIVGDSLALFVGSPRGDGALKLHMVRPWGGEYLARAQAAIAYLGSKSSDAEGRAVVRRASRGQKPLQGQGSEADVRRLAEMLLPTEILEAVAGATSIVVVPSGNLWSFPFQALLAMHPASGMRSLAVPVRYAPSLSFLQRAERLASEAAKRRGGATVPMRALVVAAPERGPRDDFPVLPGMRREGRATALMLNARLLLGPAATPDAVRRALHDVDLVHFTSHAEVAPTPELSRLSFLALARTGRNLGLLRATDIEEDPLIDLSGALVILSACNTGQGQFTTGEGTVGLARSFMLKGASAVVSSIWAVDDDATALLIERFIAYATGTSPLNRAEALRRAQDDIRRMPQYAAPYYWAGFQLVGVG